jgi:hypothetical protein
MSDPARDSHQPLGPIALRLVAVLGSFALSGYGVLFGYAALISFMVPAPEDGFTYPRLMWLVDLMFAYAWIAWLVLGFAWAFQRRLHGWWPISGLVAGTGSVLFTFGFAVVFTLPAIIMAIVFVTFHLSDEARRIEAARRALATSVQDR